MDTLWTRTIFVVTLYHGDEFVVKNVDVLLAGTQLMVIV